MGTKQLRGPMRFLLLSLMTLMVLTLPGAVHAQTATGTTPPVTLPDLTPDVIVKQKYQQAARLRDEGRSVIAPSMEPWQKEQRAKDRGRKADEIFKQLPYQVQSQILDETYTVNNECHQYGLYAQFHDCDCLGSRYFEERVFNPEDSKDSIVGHIAGECASLPGVAGYGYDQCLSSMRYVLVAARTGDYCTCFANKLAENYKMSPNPDFDNLRALSSMTNTYCLQSVKSAFKQVP